MRAQELIVQCTVENRRKGATMKKAKAKKTTIKVGKKTNNGKKIGLKIGVKQV